MSDQRDPRIQAAIVELAGAARRAPTLDEISANVESGTRADSGPRRVPNWAASFGAAAAVVIVIGGVSWFLGRSERSAVEEPVPPATSITATETTSTSIPETPTTVAPDSTPATPVSPGDPGTATVFEMDDGLPSDFGSNVAVLEDGTAWVSVVRDGSYSGRRTDCSWAMARYDGADWSTLEMADDGSTPPPRTEYCGGTPFRGASGDGTLWFQDASNVWSWSNGEWTAHDGVSFNPDAPLWIGADGTVVAARGAHQLARYANGSWGFHDAEVSNLVGLLGGEDAVAADGGGIWANFAMQCMSGGVDDEGVLWLTGSARARASFDGANWTVAGDPAEDWASWCIAGVGPPSFESDGTVWYAAEGGLIRWNDDIRTVWNLADTWTSSAAIGSFGYNQEIAVASDGRVWIPTAGSLVVFDPSSETWDRVTPDAGLPRPTESTSIAADRHGSIWLAGPTGVARYTPAPAEPSPTDAVDKSDLASLEWERILLPTDAVTEDYLPAFERVGADRVFAMPDGTLFVTGHAEAGPAGFLSLMWTSRNGANWVPVTIDPENADFLVENVTATDAGYLVKGVANLGSGPPSADARFEYWSSSNGVNWSLEEQWPFDADTPSPLDALFDGEGAGWAFASVSDAGLASVFGTEATPGAVVVSEDRIIVVGTLHDGWTDPVVWIAQLPNQLSDG